MVCYAPRLIRIQLQVVKMNQIRPSQVHWSSSVASASPLFSSSSASVSRSTTRTLSESAAQSSRTRWETWTWPSPAWSSSPWCFTQSATTCSCPGNCCFQGKEWWKLQWKIVSCIMIGISWLQSCHHETFHDPYPQGADGLRHGLHGDYLPLLQSRHEGSRSSKASLFELHFESE